MNMRHQRWLEFLAAYNFDIEYIPGKDNKVADALSRKHQNAVLAMITEWKDLEASTKCRV